MAHRAMAQAAPQSRGAWRVAGGEAATRSARPRPGWGLGLPEEGARVAPLLPERRRHSRSEWPRSEPAESLRVLRARPRHLA